MVLVNGSTQSSAKNMRVYLRCGNIGMAEHGLQAAQVGSAFEQVSGKAMAEHVRCQILPQPDVLAVIFQ